MKGFIHQNTLYFHPPDRHKRVGHGRDRRRNSLNVPRRFGRVCLSRVRARAPFATCVIGRTVSSVEGVRVTREAEKNVRGPSSPADSWNNYVPLLPATDARAHVAALGSAANGGRRSAWPKHGFYKRNRKGYDIKSKESLPISPLTHQTSISSSRPGI